MQTDRKTHWEAVHAGARPEEKSWFEAHPGASVDLITGVADPGRRVVDVGGGASTLVDHLLDLGYARLGVLDVSGQALDLARRRLGARAGRVQWIEADVTRYRADEPWDVWHDRAVFHFLTEAADRAAYVEALAASLRPGGHAVVATFDLEGPNRCSGLDVVRYGPESLAAELGSGLVLETTRGVVHTTPGGAEQAFNYCRFRLRD